MKIQVLLFVVITGRCAPENLHGSSFVFSVTSRTDRVVLKPTTITGPMSEITVCLQYYTDVVQRDTLIKVEAENSKSQFHLYQVPEYYAIAVDRTVISFKTSKESMEWRLICVSWESGTGVIHLVVNGKLFPRRVVSAGYIMNPNVTVVLGQNLVDPNLYRGAPSFVGEIKNVNVWDRALHPNELQSMYYNNCYYCNGSVITWESVDYEIFGDILLYKPYMKP
ncbi:jeltraxin-like [Anomaloglossus baeobatrachus]|uniref:jeltraxin-like n=1 Tax=Anomaloglossus baeobatrachus TaxID=238106 RepID=UPI003F50536B